MSGNAQQALLQTTTSQDANGAVSGGSSSKPSGAVPDMTASLSAKVIVSHEEQEARPPPAG